MQFLSNLLSTFGAINQNAWITIVTFLVNNLTVLLVITVMAFVFYQDIRLHDYDFIQDRRKLM